MRVEEFKQSLAPEAADTISNAVSEAQRLHHPYLLAEHVLISLIRGPYREVVEKDGDTRVADVQEIVPSIERGTELKLLGETGDFSSYVDQEVVELRDKLSVYQPKDLDGKPLPVGNRELFVGLVRWAGIYVPGLLFVEGQESVTSSGRNPSAFRDSLVTRAHLYNPEASRRTLAVAS